MGSPRRRRGVVFKVSIAAGAVAAILVAVVAVAPLLVDWEQVRKAVEREGSRALGRKVTIDRLKVRVLTGVEIEGFEIGPRPKTSHPSIVRARRVIARYRLLPLLLMRVVIDRIELVSPEIVVSRSRRGEWSFSDLVRAPGKPLETKKRDGKDVPLVSVSVAISTVRVSEGTLVFKDRTVKPARTSGVRNLDMRIKGLNLYGDMAGIRIRGDVAVGGRTVPVRVSGALGVDLVDEIVTMDGLSVFMPGAEFVADGEVSRFRGSSLSFKVEIRGDVDLEESWECAGQFVSDDLGRDLHLEGGAELHLELRGSAKRPRFRGSVALEHVEIRQRDQDAVAGDLVGAIVFDQDRVSTSNLRLIAFGNPFAFMCDIRNLGLESWSNFSIRKFSPRGKFVLDSPRLVLDRLMPSGGGGDGEIAPAEEAPAAREPDLRYVLPRGVNLEGELRFSEVVYRKIKVQDLAADIVIRNGNASAEMKSTLYSGRQAGSLKLTMTEFPVRFAIATRVDGCRLKGLSSAVVEAFVTDARAVKGRVSGTASGRAALAGVGVTGPALRKHLAGKGEFRIDDGEIRRFSFFQKGLGRLTNLRFLSRDFGFDFVAGTFSLANGRIQSPDLVMEPGQGGDLGLGWLGWVGFDGRLKGEMSTRFHPRHSRSLRRGDIGSYLFTEKDGWALASWDVAGTVSGPVLTPSKKHMKKVLQERAEEHAPEARKQAGQLLRRLFGR